MTNLAEVLGRAPEARLVIIVAEGLGSSNAANLAVYRALRSGVATSASLQVPCPWARGAVLHHQGEDVGVALTVNAEHDAYRWGPITVAPSLLDGDGGFPRTPADLWEHADVEEVRREARSQVERAILWGFDVSHLSAHLDALCSRPEFFDVLLDLAVDYDLPVVLPDPEIDLGFPARTLAAEEGVFVPDHVVPVPLPREARAGLEAAVTDLAPGVTVLQTRPAEDSPELRAITPNWAARVGDAHLITHDWGFRAALARSGAELIGFRELRDAQRRRRR
jgi:chitin disaccharide deacetylase